MTSNTMQPEQRLYNIASDRRAADDRLPTPEELREALSTLGAVEEFFTGPISHGVIQTANRVAPDPSSVTVTFEDVARLVGWADNVVLEAKSIIESAERVMVVARAFLLDSAGGYHTDETPFKDNGVLADDLGWDCLRRLYGFGRPRG
jgi:hypothetical protein